MDVHTMVKYKKYLKEVDQFVTKYKYKMRLSDWEINIKFSGAKEGAFLMTTLDSIEYKMATISVFQEYIDEQDIEKREQYVVHELAHILIDKMEDKQNKFINGLLDIINKVVDMEREELVENISQAIMSVKK
jgi:hypothetical protein